jgi:hypothetical protein
MGIFQSGRTQQHFGRIAGNRLRQLPRGEVL